ncbi:hypothetical protein [Aeromonas jandaei]|uniref:hypothetical protein n=1 Tax=Aeromonas jandaei TaxID=650 RepID=UPI003B9DF62F
MNKFLDKIEDCQVDGKVLLKASFGLISNFSLVEHIAHKAMAEKGAFEFDGNYETKFKSSVTGLSIEPDLKVLSCSLNEHPVERGYYDVDIICEYTIPQDFHNREAYNDNMRLSPLADSIFNFFKLMSTLNNRVSILEPSSLNLRIKSGNDWLRVIQKGGGYPNIYPCDPAHFQKVIQSLPAYYDKVKDIINEKKTQKIINIYYSGLRFQNNHFAADAFINFYKVIELIYKDKALFSKKYIKLLNKPESYDQAMRQCSQKVQMLFIWEYLNKFDEKNHPPSLLKKLLELAETRNDLAHDSGDNLDRSKLILVQIVANFMLHHFVLGK